MKTKLTLFKNLSNTNQETKVNPEELSRDSKTLKLIVFLATVLICSLFFSFQYDMGLTGIPEVKISGNNIWNGKTIIASYSFPVYKSSKQYQLDIANARSESPNVYQLSSNNENKAYELLASRLNQLKAVSDTISERSFDSIDFSNLGIVSELFPIQQLETFFQQGKRKRTQSIKKIQNNIEDYLHKIYLYGFVNQSVKEISTSIVYLETQANVKKIYASEYLTDNVTFKEKFKETLKSVFSELELQMAEEIVEGLSFPNLIFSESLTEKYSQLAVENVARSLGVVKEGSKIISYGEPLSPERIAQLESYYKADLLQRTTIFDLWHFLGSLLHSFILVLILFLYIFYIRKRIYNNNLQLTILSSILIFTGLMSWLSLRIPTPLPIEYFVLIPSLSMLSAILFDSRTAFYTTVAMSMMLAGIRGSDYEIALVMLFAGSLAAYSVRDIQSRTQMYSSILYMFIGFVVGIVSIGLERSDEITVILNKLILASINSAISPIVTFGLLFLIERTTNITTDLKLQEYNNLNHPLLLKLNDMAPGTYQHTQGVALLAERCASAIGANPLLTKVGAYFHDIGKMVKPEYFTENQIGIENKHDLISPRKSVEAIKGHVEEGIRLAHSYKLPQRIVDFIPMHHGTTLIKHFYAEALEQAANPDDVNETDFRYPGPKPDNRETAIIMICDSAEALSKVKNITSEQLEKAIDSIIKERFLDGQFDESNISFSDLKIIKNTSLKHLVGKSHSRVKYKEIPVKKDETETES